MTNRPNDQGPRTPSQGQRPTYEPPPPRPGGYQRQSLAETMAKSFIRSIASSLGRIIVRAMTGRR